MLLAAEGNVMDAVRAYLREMRIGRRISQDELADAIGLSRRALIDWEMGRTEDIKSGAMIKAIAYLRGAVSDIATLVDASLDRGIELAKERLAIPTVQLSEEHQQQLQSLAQSIPEERVGEVLALLEELQRKDKTGEWLNFGRFLRNAE